ncbi:hypothetical protein SAMN05421791_10312 [Facklamia miroungae]|uniref:Uncharacterized protein n=2 Tax=Facklamia miroungae TaxID=120956 RepID=A0A1G7REU1_9LACT|nr:hypothetical protein [Facklamia miroungae]SDG09165.1 hypothetical protein SAMN05421791_10312 [Facklamia miroungae]
MNHKIKNIKELVQYLTLYSTIFFSDDGTEVVMKDKKNNKEYKVISNIKNINGEKGNYFTINVYQEDGVHCFEYFDKLITEIMRN